MNIEVREATPSDLESLSVLFDGYRQFYEQPADLARAKFFVSERLERLDSVLLVASNISGELIGFTQLFPAFSSVATARTYILNDLFVATGSRNVGVAGLLLDAACEAGRITGGIRLSLSTAVSNIPAQKLYEAKGWLRNERFLQYGISLQMPNQS